MNPVPGTLDDLRRATEATQAFRELGAIPNRHHAIGLVDDATGLQWTAGPGAFVAPAIQ